MLPHDQDNNINSGSSNILVRTRIENMSLQIEPTGNVSPRVNDEVLDLQQQSNHAKLSVLRESLRPVTLKVLPFSPLFFIKFNFYIYRQYNRTGYYIVVLV